MMVRWNNPNALSRALEFLAGLWRSGTGRYRPERHYLRGKPSGVAPRRPDV